MTSPSIGARKVINRTLTAASALVVCSRRCSGDHPSAIAAASASTVLIPRRIMNSPGGVAGSRDYLGLRSVVTAVPRLNPID